MDIFIVNLRDSDYEINGNKDILTLRDYRGEVFTYLPRIAIAAIVDGVSVVYEVEGSVDFSVP